MAWLQVQVRSWGTGGVDSSANDDGPTLPVCAFCNLSSPLSCTEQGHDISNHGGSFQGASVILGVYLQSSSTLGNAARTNNKEGQADVSRM